MKPFALPISYPNSIDDVFASQSFQSFDPSLVFGDRRIFAVVNINCFFLDRDRNSLLGGGLAALEGSVDWNSEAKAYL